MVMAAVSAGLQTFLDDVGGIVTAGMTWVSSVWTQVTGDPVLMAIVVGLPLVGIGVGLLGRLIRV